MPRQKNIQVNQDETWQSAVAIIIVALVLFFFFLGKQNGCDGSGYGKYGRCQANTSAGSQCKSNAGKSGYCGSHR